MTDELVKIYNNAIDTLESVGAMYWTIGEARKYAHGYIEALIKNGLITYEDGVTLSFELNDAIDEIKKK